ncbi:histidine phosphatase family protein [Nocardioides terrisoli]|uniref:histidine phosphatase family protein n=1 Tax=Nocardioides terrisoli TaxID=3388267 RepID=UPI00287BA6B4|nr:histidine phosphatase family protein [Nocardioides marmorisolisilvae]
MPDPFYLTRHGQSEWNVLRLTQGQTSHPRLTDLGREQAVLAALRIKRDLGGAAVSRILTSDLVRAVETAQIIATIAGGAVEADPRLREQALGALEGKTYDETWAAAEAHEWSDPTLPVAGGESPADVRDRMAAALAEVPRRGPTVLVSHGDAIRAAVGHLRGEPAHRTTWVEVPNGAVARVDTAVTWLD